MNYRILQTKGGFEKDITKGVAIFLFCALFIFCLCMAWVLFAPLPRLERVKIAVMNKNQLAQIQKVHGAYNTRCVIYTNNSKPYFYRHGEKIYLNEE